MAQRLFKPDPLLVPVPVGQAEESHRVVFPVHAVAVPPSSQGEGGISGSGFVEDVKAQVPS